MIEVTSLEQFEASARAAQERYDEMPSNHPEREGQAMADLRALNSAATRVFRHQSVSWEGVVRELREKTIVDEVPAYGTGCTFERVTMVTSYDRHGIPFDQIGYVLTSRSYLNEEAMPRHSIFFAPVNRVGLELEGDKRAEQSAAAEQKLQHIPTLHETLTDLVIGSDSVDVQRISKIIGGLTMPMLQQAATEFINLNAGLEDVGVVIDCPTIMMPAARRSGVVEYEVGEVDDAAFAGLSRCFELVPMLRAPGDRRVKHSFYWAIEAAVGDQVGFYKIAGEQVNGYTIEDNGSA